jgi:hypothetical protein
MLQCTNVPYISVKWLWILQSSSNNTIPLWIAGKNHLNMSMICWRMYLKHMKTLLFLRYHWCRGSNFRTGETTTAVPLTPQKHNISNFTPIGATRVSTKAIFYFRQNRNTDEILSLFRQNFEVSIFRNFDIDSNIGISISVQDFGINVEIS